MADDTLNPFAFEAGKSWLAVFHPVAKLAFLIAVASAAMRSEPGLLAALFLIAFIEQFSMPRAGKGALYSISVLILFSALVRGILPGDGRIFDVGTLSDSAIYALRLLTVYLYSRLFYATTRVSEIGDWMTAFTRTMRRIVGVGQRDVSAQSSAAAAVNNRPTIHNNNIRQASILSDPGMLFSLVLLFLPRIFDTYQRIKEAGEVRAINLSRRNLRRSLAMLEQLIIASIVQAWRTAAAMEIRAYSPSRTLRLQKFAWGDWTMAGAAIALLFLAQL
ncbi:MAG: energy-coupling factor transporter transmembrane component T family protein [Spirochaetota bacterium]